MGLNLQLALKEVVDFTSQGCQGLNFTKPINDNGTPTRYYKILQYIMANGPSRRIKINAEALGLIGESKKDHYKTVYAGLHASGLLKYNTKGCTWSLGEKFSAYNRAVMNHIELQQYIKQCEA